MTALIRTTFVLTGLVIAPGAALSAAESRPVLVELFTSQGCSSCPPADKLLAEIADRPDVIALSLHVDYWDYLGWKDEFGSERHTDRQRAYASHANERMIYTPQMVIEGRERLVGSQTEAVLAAISRHSATKEGAALAVSAEGDRLSVLISPPEGGAPGENRPGENRPGGIVTMAWLTSAETIRITAGENSGRTALYRNVVRGWATLGDWNGGEASFAAAIPPGADAVVVMVQAGEGGPILCSRRIDID